MSQEQSARSDGAPWMSFAKAWTRASEHMTRSFLAANRATAAAFGLSPSSTTRDRSVETPISGMAYQDEEWSFEGSADSYEEFGVGDTVRFTKRIADADVQSFAHASGDTNRLHLDEQFAEESRFGSRIAHGTLVAGTISAALARLPLVTIYLSQDLTFLRPVDIGERITATCEVLEDLGDHRYRLSTDVETEDGEPIVEGEAVVLIDELPE